MSIRVVVIASILINAAAIDDAAALLQEGQWPGTRPTQPPQPAQAEQPATQPLVIQIPQAAFKQSAGAQPQVLVVQSQAAAPIVDSQVNSLESQSAKSRVLAEVDQHEEQAAEKKTGDTKSAFEKEHIYIPKKAHDPYKHGRRNGENTEEWYHSVASWNTWFKKKMQLWQKYRPFDAQVYKKWLDDIKQDSAQRCKWIGSGAPGYGVKTTDDLYAQVTQCMWGMMMASQPLPPFTPPFVQKLLMEEQAELKTKMDEAGISAENAASGAQQISPEMEMSIAASQTSPLKNQWMFALIPHIHRSEGWDIKHR